jgi:hypothetical protein
LQGDAAKKNGSYIFIGLRNMANNVGGDWSALSSGDKQTLLQWELDGQAGAPVAAGILRSVNYTDTMPEVLLPQVEKRGGEASERALVRRAVALAAYPNPANQSTMITWPMRLKGLPWELRDLFGKRVASGRLSANGLLELDLSVVSEGAYQLVIPGTDEEQRIVVVH